MLVDRQWGKLVGASAKSVYTFTFPISFHTDCFAVTIAHWGEDRTYAASIISKDVKSVDIGYNNSNAKTPTLLIAIGC